MTLERIFWAKDRFLRSRDLAPASAVPVGDPFNVIVYAKTNQNLESEAISQLSKGEGFTASETQINAFSLGTPLCVNRRNDYVFAAQYYHLS